MRAPGWTSLAIHVHQPFGIQGVPKLVFPGGSSETRVSLGVKSISPIHDMAIDFSEVLFIHRRAAFSSAPGRLLNDPGFAAE